MKLRNTLPYREYLLRSCRYLTKQMQLPPCARHMTQMAHRMFLLEGETSAINVNTETPDRVREG